MAHPGPHVSQRNVSGKRVVHFPQMSAVRLHGTDMRSASAAWKRLASSEAGGGLVTGLAWLGVAQIAGANVLREAKPAESQSAHEAFVALAAAEEAFAGASDSGTAQAHMMAGQVEYLIGNADAAFQELKTADELFEKAKDLDGWTDLNIVGGLGLNRIGKTKDSENAILDAEEGLGKLRVEPDQIKQLAAWVRRMPSLVGKADPRPLESRLADAREFHRWTSSTDPMLEIIALQSLAAVLREGGYLGDADFYDAVRRQLEERYHALVPLSMRIGRAAMADYDLLLQTRELEQVESANLRSYTKLMEAHIAAQQAMREEAFKLYPELNTPDANDALKAYSEGLRKIAAQADDAGAKFAKSMKAGDHSSAVDALAQRSHTMEVLLDFLNTNNPTTKLPSGTETVKQEFLREGKLYEIHGDISFQYRFEVPSDTKLEVVHEEKYIDLIRDTLLSVVLNDERYLRRGVRNMVSFYDQYRTEISPANLLDLPFTFQNGWDDPAAMPTEKATRDSLIDKAMTEMRRQGREKVLNQAVAAYPDVAAALSQKTEPFAKTDSTEKEDAGFAFFPRNWADTAQSAVQKHDVSRADQDGKVVIQIHHASTNTFDLKKESEYSALPAPAAGIDLEARSLVGSECPCF